MTDYVSLWAVLDIVMQYCPDDDGGCTKADRDIRDMLDEIEGISAADVEPVDRWISVKDKLPDEMQDKSIYSGWSEEIRPSESVLILTTGGSYDVAWYSYTFNDWTTDNETKSYEDWEVAYWQPLPKRAKEN